MTGQTPLQEKASAWQSTQAARLLLRGKELAGTEEQAAKYPAPTPLQRQFLLASRKNETRRRRRTLSAAIAAGIIMLALAMNAFTRANLAVNQATDAFSSGTEQARTAQAASTSAVEQIQTAQTDRTQALEDKEAIEKEARRARASELVAFSGENSFG